MNPQSAMSECPQHFSCWNSSPVFSNLTPEQAAQLTSDMVWLVTKEVTLADGSKQSVLVPQVYVRVKPGDIDGNGALLAGADVSLNLSGDATNSGTIAGRNLVQINASNIKNLGGNMSADTLALQASVMSECPQHFPYRISTPIFSNPSFVGLVFDGLAGLVVVAQCLLFTQMLAPAQAASLPGADSGAWGDLTCLP